MTGEPDVTMPDTPPVPDWTADPETGHSNSSQEFRALTAEMTAILQRSGGLCLSPQWAASTAALIMAQLAHVHGLTPAKGVPASQLRAEADRLESEGITRKWGLLDAEHRLTDDGANGRFVALEPDQLRFAAQLVERLRGPDTLGG